tara:strand:+ start:3558 stop:3797 length:240 start_codon:yes stop_codon:yes gene_type:complete
MNDNNLHETSMTFAQPLEKTTRSRGRPSFAEKAEPSLRDTFSLEIIKGVLASGVAIEDPLALSRYAYKIADALVKVRDE